MKVVFKIERKSSHSKYYQVTKTKIDEDGMELGRPEVVSIPLSHDAAAAFRDRCEKEPFVRGLTAIRQKGAAVRSQHCGRDAYPNAHKDARRTGAADQILAP